MKIYKHFSHTTPFSAAENEQELAEIMRLKYPKACSNLEVGAEFFARMVEEVRQFEAWRVIGFGSFEEFCAQKLGKTLAEVEEIVETVKEIGGDCTLGEVQEVIRQKKSDAIRKLHAEQPELSKSQLGEQTNASLPLVNYALKKKGNQKSLTKPQPTIKLASIERTAANIIRKMGGDYAHRLAQALQEAA